MRAPTPVTNRAMVIDSGSARKPMSTASLPAGTHSNRVNTVSRSSPSWPTSPMNTNRVAMNEPPIMAVASQPARGSPRRRPSIIKINTPASGKAGISQTRSTSVLIYLSPRIRCSRQSIDTWRRYPLNAERSSAVA